MNLVKKAGSDFSLFWNILREKGVLEAIKADYNRAKKEMNAQGYQYPFQWFHNFSVNQVPKTKNTLIKIIIFLKEKITLKRVISLLLIGSIILGVFLISFVWYAIIGFFLLLVLLKIISFIL